MRGASAGFNALEMARKYIGKPFLQHKRDASRPQRTHFMPSRGCST